MGSGERSSPDDGAPFGEDGSAIRVGHAAENMTTLRRLALNLVKGEKSLKIGVAAKRKRAGWDLEYLRTIHRLGRVDTTNLTQWREGRKDAIIALLFPIFTPSFPRKRESRGSETAFTRHGCP